MEVGHVDAAALGVREDQSARIGLGPTVDLSPQCAHEFCRDGNCALTVNAAAFEWAPTLFPLDEELGGHSRVRGPRNDRGTSGRGNPKIAAPQRLGFSRSQTAQPLGEHERGVARSDGCAFRCEGTNLGG